MRSLFSAVLAMAASVVAAMPPTPAQEVFKPQAQSELKLTDYLTVDSHVGIYYGYLRDSNAVSSRLLSHKQPTVVFAPTNQAIMGMDRLPHKGPEGDDDAQVELLDDEKRRAEYLEQWVSRFLVDGSDVDFSSDSVQSLSDKNKITLDGDSWSDAKLGPPYAAEKEVRVVDRLEAADGVLYKIDGVLDFDY